MSHETTPTIPRPALILGAAGLLPFLYGAATLIWPPLSVIGFAWDMRFSGAGLLQIYGIVILCFMAGVIWGFAARAAQASVLALGLVFSVLPALLTFFFAFSETRFALLVLMTGFAGLLAIDLWAVEAGIAPAWWLRLRLGLSTVVLICLAIGWVYG